MNVSPSLDLPMPITLDSPRDDGVDRSARLARRAANHRIAFIAHYIVFTMTIAIVWLAGGFMAAVFTGLAWGIGLACHGFFGGVAPVLRQRWTRSEMQKLSASTS